MARCAVRLHTRRFFGSGGQGLLTRRVEYPMYELPQLHQALADCFADWRLLAEGGGPAVTDALWTPQTTRMLAAPGRWLDCSLQATRFYRLPDGGRRVLAIKEWGDGIRIALVGARREEERMAVACGLSARTSPRRSLG